MKGFFDMKKVLFVIESLGGGGAEKVLTTIVKYLDKSKYDITVLLVTEVGIYLKEVKKYCRVVAMLPSYDSLESFVDKLKYKLDYKYIYSSSPRKVHKKYIKEEYDIEIAFVEGYATRLIANSPNKNSKKIAWVHIDMKENPYADQYYKSLEEHIECYKNFNDVICVSSSVKKVMEDKFKLENNLKVIYNPIDAHQILEKAKEFTVKKDLTKTNIITVGRLENQKGFDRLINAIGRINSDKLNIHLNILGEGSKYNELKDLIHLNKLENTVSLLGFKKNPFPWVLSSDIFICTSRAEGYSLVIAEAMVLGIPIISVNCSGPNELLDFGKYGLLIENSDSAIRDVLCSIVDKKINLENLKLLSNHRGKDFKLANILEQIEEVFDK